MKYDAGAYNAFVFFGPSYGTASRTCLDCYKEHDMHHSKPIEDIESLTAKQILCQRKSKALTTIFGGHLSKAAPQLAGGNTKAICSSCQGTLGRLLYSISGRGKKAAPVFQFLTTKKFGNGHHPSAAQQQVKSNLDRSCIFSHSSFAHRHCQSHFESAEAWR